MREIAIAAFSIAVGAAIQVSGFGGTIAIVITWTAVVAISLWMYVLSSIRGGREEADQREQPTTQRAIHTGHELVGFFQEREADAPQPSTNSITMFKRGSEAREHKSRRTYDAETMRLYQQRFAERVSDISHGLRRAGRIGGSEFRTLISPRQPHEIELVGRRLIELGYPEE